MSTMQIDRLLETVVREDASDLHLTTGRPPTVRLNGRLKSLATKVLDNDDMTALMKSVTPEKNQQELQEVGATDFGFAFGDKARFRVAIFKQRGDIAMVLRLIPNKLLTFEQIGLPEVSRELIRRPRGLFIVTGPTGSGKTTTLAASLAVINEATRKILTVEDPVEYQIPGITQTQVHPGIGLTFASALRSFMRLDPDVIMVGEMRDSETAHIGVHAALTGHLVLTTLHTNTAAGAITRLIDMGIESFLLASCARVIVAQRLVRILCDHCKESYRLSAADVAADERYAALGIAAGEVVCRPKGCDWCGSTGFRGRKGVFEIMEIGPPVRRAIGPKTDASELEAVARAAGMTSMTEDGIEKLRAGQTTLDEIFRLTTSL